MKVKALMLAFILIAFPFGCKQNHKDLKKKEAFQKEFLIAKYFGVSFEGEDDLHVLQFNLYKMPSGEIKGDYYDLFAAFDPIPDKAMNDHINKRKPIDQNIFTTINPHIGNIERASLVGDNLSLSTSFIEYDKNTRIGWAFSGKVEKNKSTGKITEFFTPIYDESKTISVPEVGKVQTFSKHFFLTKVE